MQNSNSRLSTDADQSHDSALKSCIDLLGRVLGRVIGNAHGQDLLDCVEHIRQLAKSSRLAESDDSEKNKRQELIAYLHGLPQEKLILVARAFNQFLNLANIAEQLYSSNTVTSDSKDFSSISEQIIQLKESGVATANISAAIDKLWLELVLTAHPTEVTRRTLIEKQNRIYHCLHELETRKLDDSARQKLYSQIEQLIAQWWHTDEIRTEKPTPVDEAVWGFAVIENSLWEAIPTFINHISGVVAQQLNYQLPIDYAPIGITSWMGGDRDGNPNVTAVVTEEVIRLARWKSADLFLSDINLLMSELSMHQCSAELRAIVGDVKEPYRAALRELRGKLQNTLGTMDDLIKGREASGLPIIESSDELWQPLHLCYQSLQQCNMGNIADGSLRDTLRRVKCFGSHLVRLDIRQESSRHSQVFAELTRYLELGDYGDWQETERVKFLTQELNNKRPLIPRHWRPSADVQEVLDTFATIAKQPQEALGAYIISMAKRGSDVLAVQLLLKEFECPALPIAPLFETLDDLNNAADTMREILSIPVYRDAIDNKHMIMIGYSDSSKDAGVMAASWAQYRAQEAIISVCREEGVQPMLFHGRGGTTGRGGAPAHAALLSQPPGSLENGLRVTEQGEMIRFKLGLPQKAMTTFNLYTNAILESNLNPPPEPQQDWRDIVDQLAELSAKQYRQLVFDTPEFLDYFRSATPIQELSKLPLGSRPAKRRADGGVESLRAIPWSFAWSQNRLMLPAWLGAGEALEQLISDGQKPQLEAMCQQWPFFSTRISMLEMVYAKTDSALAAYYDALLVSKELQPLGETLRARLQRDIELTLSIANDENLLQDLPWLKESLKLRNTYIDPLNLLQVELLERDRNQTSSDVEKALMVTIAGIAAGLRNTG
ncbi:phosphoenolpyruvate carboxylase [Aurantivibrio plasticivorans]